MRHEEVDVPWSHFSLAREGLCKATQLGKEIGLGSIKLKTVF